MNTKNETMGYAFLGHLTLLNEIFDVYRSRPQSPSTVEEQTELRRKASVFYTNTTNLIARNQKLWTYDYESFDNDNLFQGVDKQTWSSVFNNLFGNLISIGKSMDEEGFYLLEYISKIPVKEAVSQAMIIGLRDTTHEKRNVLEEGIAIRTDRVVTSAYLKSIKRAFLIQDDPNPMDVSKGYVDTDDLFRIYNKLLSHHIESYPNFLATHNDDDRTISLIPDSLIKSSHSLPETLSDFIALAKKIKSHEMDLHHNDTYTLINYSTLRVRITDSNNLMGREVHASVPEVDGKNFFAKRQLDKKEILIDYLTWLSETHTPKIDNRNQYIKTIIQNPSAELISAACHLYVNNSQNINDTALTPALITRVIEDGMAKGVDMHASMEDGRSIIDDLNRDLRDHPEVLSMCEKLVFDHRRYDGAKKNPPDTDINSVINAFSI